MKKYIIILLCAAALCSCRKYLSEKPDAKLAVPTTLGDFQAILDRYPVINDNDPVSGEISSDDYYVTTSDYLALTDETDRRKYTWQKVDLFIPQGNDWYYTYRPVFTANTVLEGLAKVTENSGNRAAYDNVRGQACYIRGKAFLLAAGLWSKAYDPATAATDMGIPLRLSSDFNEPSIRGTVQQTFAQVISDLSAAAAYLPLAPVQVVRPSKPAAFALLARAYLYMGEYEKAGLYADSCLRLYNKLLDYNTLNPASAGPVPQFNAEVLQDSFMPAPEIVNNSQRTDSLLYNSYAANDLRKVIFFRRNSDGSHSFKGSYEGYANLFSGVATDEVYLTRAECYARGGNTDAAMKDLNTLLVNRFITGSFVPYTAANSNDALALILAERRKELLMRGLRWTDLKRLNREGAAISLTRHIDGQVYTLPPNDTRYALPIPDDIIALTGMQQNPR